MILSGGHGITWDCFDFCHFVNRVLFTLVSTKLIPMNGLLARKRIYESLAAVWVAILSLFDCLAYALRVPIDCAAKPICKRRAGSETKKRLGFANIESAARLPLRLRGVPHELALEARHPRD